METLNRREREIVHLMAAGLMDAEIGHELTLGLNTIKWYARQIYSKFGVRNRREAIAKARELGYLDEATRNIGRPERVPISFPLPITSFIGRQREIHEIQLLFRKTRLVTLTGSGGSGKTRLALQVAAKMQPIFDDGAAFISLAALQDSSLLATHIAQSMGADLSQRETPLVILQRHLRDQHYFLILDNFEHLIEAAPLVTDLLTAAPRLSVLVTSRELLHLSGEYQYLVRPLPLPNGAQDFMTLAENEAIQLFCERAQAVLSDFRLTESNAVDIAEICVQLDGLPLAIELAAARIKRYAPHTLSEKLRHRLDILTDGPRDAPQRQKTLRNTLAWSYDLLTVEEKILFARMGVFMGGCTIDAALVVAGTGLHNPERVLESLADKNLMRIEGHEDEPRCTMLETMRDYALEQLGLRGELEIIQFAHAEFFLEIADHLSLTRVVNYNNRIYVDQVEYDFANICAVLDWALRRPNGRVSAIGLRICGALILFWTTFKRERVGRVYTEALLRQADCPAVLRAGALLTLAHLYYHLDESPYLRLECLTEALTIYQAAEVEIQIAWTQCFLSDTLGRIGQVKQALDVISPAIVFFRATENYYGLATALNAYGELLYSQGAYREAVKVYEEGDALRQQLGGIIDQSLVRPLNLARTLVELGEFDRAEANVKRSIAAAKWWSLPVGATYILPLMVLVTLRVAQGQHEMAVQLRGAVETMQHVARAHGQSTPYWYEADAALATARAQLGDAAFEAAYATGMALTHEEVLTLLEL